MFYRVPLFTSATTFCIVHWKPRGGADCTTWGKRHRVEDTARGGLDNVRTAAVAWELIGWTPAVSVVLTVHAPAREGAPAHRCRGCQTTGCVSYRVLLRPLLLFLGAVRGLRHHAYIQWALIVVCWNMGFIKIRDVFCPLHQWVL